MVQNVGWSHSVEAANCIQDINLVTTYDPNWKEKSCHQTLLFAAVQPPHRFLQSIECAIETSCRTHSHAATVLLPNCCKNSKIGESEAKRRRFNGLRRTAADASPRFSWLSSFLLWLTWAEPRWVALVPSKHVWATGVKAWSVLEQLQRTNNRRRVRRSAARRNFLPLYNRHRVTTVKWGWIESSCWGRLTIQRADRWF